VLECCSASFQRISYLVQLLRGLDEIRLQLEARAVAFDSSMTSRSMIARIAARPRLRGDLAERLDLDTIVGNCRRQELLGAGYPPAAVPKSSATPLSARGLT